MLSKTRKNSPMRLAGGMIGVSALTLAALGLTASGTSAAETLKTNVEAATGISLGQDAPPPPQDAPPPPAAPHGAKPPAAPAAPGAPEAPHERHVVRVITTDGHGGHRKEERVVVVNGRNVEVNGERVDIPDEAEIMAMVPDVQSGHCKTGNKDDMVVETPARDGKRQTITICVNRIRAEAGEARRIAIESRNVGVRSALMGLRHARMAIEADTTLSPDQKREALKGIDEAIRELQRNDKG